MTVNVENPEGIYWKNLHRKSAEQNPKRRRLWKNLMSMRTTKGIKELLKACFDFILQKAQRTPKSTGNSNLW